MELPTEMGWYWYKTTDRQPIIVFVFIKKDAPVYQEVFSFTARPLKGANGLWWGPLAAPPENPLTP